MKLSKENLIIRQASVEDAEILCNWWNDGKVMAHAGFPKGLGKDIEGVIEEINKQSENSKRLIIEVDNVRIGEMCYRINENIAEIGIKICEVSYQEKGYGTELLKMLFRYLFEEMSVDKIVLDTNLKNKRAQHVYEKIGFVKVGVRIESWIDQLGQSQSAVDYELKKEDFYK